MSSEPKISTTPEDLGTSTSSAATAADWSSGFQGSMAHLYRGEMNKMTVWRERLDVTSNWAILLSIGLTTFTLGSVDVPHYTLLLGLALIAISIVIEGRRYRHLHHSKWRLYLLELGFFSELLEPDVAAEDSSWRRHLAEDLRQPEFPLTLLTSIRARLRRNYLMLIYFVTAVWLVKLFIHPANPASLNEFVQRLAVGGLIPPWFVVVTAPAFILTATLLGLTCPPAEALEDWQRWRRRGVPRYGNPICSTDPEPLDTSSGSSTARKPDAR